MKPLFSIIGISIFLLSYSSNISAQGNRGENDRELTAFEENFWYGGNIGLQISSFYTLAALEPMIGYKMDKNGAFSVGPRFSLEYTSENFGVGFDRVNSFNYGLGVFTRAKIYRGVFAHIEYEKLNFKSAQADNFGNVIVLNNEIQTERSWRNNYFIGGGFKQGTGRVGFEIAILFNISDELRPNEQPLEYRAGFNVNF
ncbi:MAG: hypothetical protein KJP00_02355 [Bacteroidia bacterium]|nr:hypothetical protein [Bacteroidia bacterium]